MWRTARRRWRRGRWRSGPPWRCWHRPGAVRKAKVSKPTDPAPVSLCPLVRPWSGRQLELLTASLMILVMTALGRFRSSGLSAMVAAGDRACDLLFRPLRRPDFPRRHGLTQRGFRPTPRGPHRVPQCPARPSRLSPSAPPPPPVAGASELPRLPWFWLGGLPSGLTGTWRPFPSLFPCFAAPSHLEINYGSLGFPSLSHSALRRCLATELPGA